MITRREAEAFEKVARAEERLAVVRKRLYSVLLDELAPEKKKNPAQKNASVSAKNTGRGNTAKR